MEEHKNPIGNIYGSRVSKNGKWLNLIIATKDKDGNDVKITCPVKLGKPYEGEKPVATILSGNGCAMISQLRVFEETAKPSEPKAEDCSGIPF